MQHDGWAPLLPRRAANIAPSSWRVQRNFGRLRAARGRAPWGTPDADGGMGRRRSRTARVQGRLTREPGHDGEPRTCRKRKAVFPRHDALAEGPGTADMASP